MEAMDPYEELKQKNKDLEILTNLIQAVHKSSDLEEIYRVALDSVMELENVDIAMIYLVDEEKQEAVLQAHRNVTEDYVRRASRIPYPKGITWKVINTGKIINIEDAQKDPDTGPAGRDLGHHSNLGIPIFLEEKVIGVIWFGSYKERKFDEREISLLSTLGNQIAIAISRAKQTKELEEGNRNLSFLSAISRAVHQSVDLDQVYRTVLDVTKDLKFIDIVGVYLVEGEGDKREAVLQVHRGYTEEYLKRAGRIPYGRGTTWKVITSGDSVYYEDASDLSTEVGHVGKALGQRALLCIPIKSGDETIGITDFSSFTKCRFSKQELDFLLSLGNQIGTAIAKARIFAKIKQREETLWNSEKRYRTLYEANPLMVFTVSTEGTVLSVNQFGAEQLGYTVEELVGQSILNVFYEEDKKAFLRHFTACLQSSNPTLVSNWEFRKVHKDGSILWVKESARVVQEANGNTTVFIICENITEHKQTEQTLRESEEKFRAVAETANDAIVSADNSGNIVYFNRAAEHIFGYSASEVVGKQLTLLMPERFYDARRHGFKRFLPTGEAHVVEKMIELAGRRKDGSEFPVELSLASKADGEILFIGILRDITECKRTEEALRESERRYRLLAENATDNIWTTDMNLRFTYISPSVTRMRGYSVEEAMAQTVDETLTPSSLEVAMKAFMEELAIESMGQKDLLRSRTLDLELTCKDGSTIWAEVKMTFLRDHDNQPVGILGVTRDITERKQAEKSLKESFAQLSKKNRYERIISTVTRSVHKSINLQEVLENAVEAMSQNMDKVDNVSIYLIEWEEAVMKAYRGYPDWFIKRVRRIPYPKGFTWKTIIEGKPRYVADVDQDTVIGPAGKEMGTKSYASMPIRYAGKTVGCININSLKKSAFDEEELKLLEIVAQQIEVAINNARQAEALQQSEERYRTLFDQSPVGVYILDKQLKITQCNERMAQILHSSCDKIIGLDMRKLKDQSFVPAMEEALEGQSSYHEGFYEATTSPAKLWLSLRFSPLRDTNGNVVSGMAVVEDITERKRAEEALREGEERYRTLIEHIYDLICEIDPSAHFLYLSPNFKEILGYEPSELLGRSVLEFIHSDDLPAVIVEIRKGFKTVSSGHAVFRFRHKNGQWHWFESAGKPLQTATGEIRAVVVSRDITEHRRMEEEFLRTQKLESVGVLAGGIAHDFNNLLTAILGNISLTKMYANLEDKMHKRLTEAEKACLRAKDLTQQLLTFSKGGTPVKKLTSTGKLIRESASFAVSGSNVKCEFFAAEDLWMVEVDEGQISQVINNLVINADQAMPQGGVIKVRVENASVGMGDRLPLKDGRYIRITVEDNGVGILKEHMPRIFDPYFTTKQKGSGLGLATAYSIIKSHDGCIGVESEVGVGTKFYIYLPASQKEILAKKDIEERSFVGRGRILVMDDEEIVRGVAGEVLRHFGYEVEFARDGREAIELYREARENSKPFDVVIMDLTIPGGMGGKETIKRLIEIDPGVKAIVSSGYSNDPVMAEYTKYGFREVLPKPYSIEDMTETIHKVINKK